MLINVLSSTNVKKISGHLLNKFMVFEFFSSFILEERQMIYHKVEYHGSTLVLVGD